MIVLRSIGFMVAFYLFSAITMTLFLPFLLGPDRWVVGFTEWWSRGISFLLRAIAGVTHEFRGRENLPPTPCIIASKHQSAWDTFIYHQIVSHPAFVMKQELLRVPLYSWYTRRLQMIVVDREAGGQALRHLVKSVKAALAHGRHVVIFPEGTRTIPGERAPYQPGIAALYSLGVPVVPVATNSGECWGRSLYKRPGKMIVEFLPPLAPDLSREEFMKQLEARIEEASEKLRQR